MALQGALFFLGLLILAVVFWFSGGRELIEQKRLSRVKRKFPATDAAPLIVSADENNAKQNKLAKLKTNKRKHSAQNKKQGSDKSRREKMSDLFGPVLVDFFAPKSKSRQKKVSNLFEHKQQVEPKLDSKVKEKNRANIQANLRGDHARLNHAHDDELLDQYGKEDGAERLEAAHNHQVPKCLRIDADEFKGVCVDYFAIVSGSQPVTLGEIMAVYQQAEFKLARSPDIYARPLGDNRWRNLKNEFENDREYGDVALTLQLADRDGPVTQSHLTHFSALVSRLSKALDRKFRFSSSFEDALEHAHNLDVFCQQYDVVVAIYVLAKDDGSFAGLNVDAAARSHSLHLGHKDIYHHMAALNGLSYSIFSMANMHNPGTFDAAALDIAKTQGLVFFINMPCSPQPADAYQSMIIAAEAICDELGGVLVDQHRKTVDRKSLENIRQQVDQIAQDMRAEGLDPGSVEAMRLFG